MARNLASRLLSTYYCCSSISRSHHNSPLTKSFVEILSHPIPTTDTHSFQKLRILIPKIAASVSVCSNSQQFRLYSTGVMEQIKDEVSSSTETTQQPVEGSEETSQNSSGQNQNEVSSNGGLSSTTGNSSSSTSAAAAQQIKTEVDSSEGQVSQSQLASTEKSEDDGKGKAFFRKKKTVLMLSYSGQGYLGMQRNPGMKTIEDDLLQALLKCGYIDEESYKKPQTIHFQRAARTDKHVSAARQIVSMKLPETVDLEQLNQNLPEQIRVMGLKKVTKGFDCKSQCDARTYMYMIPSFAFVPIDQDVTEDYRITPEVLENLREALKLFLGTKNFHNFTSRRKPTDPSSKRYIISFTASDPFVKDGLEYLILRVKGQSFMLHQIRKMIGLAVAYLRGFAGKETFVKSWCQDRIDLPKAPGVGLVLDHVHYERYNKRYGSDGMHAALTWEEAENKVEEFCQTFIYPVITKTENEDKSMFQWLSTLPYHTYDLREQRKNVPVEAMAVSGIGKAAIQVGKEVEGGADSSDADSDDDDDEIQAKRARTSDKVAA